MPVPSRRVRQSFCNQGLIAPQSVLAPRCVGWSESLPRVGFFCNPSGWNSWQRRFWLEYPLMRVSLCVYAAISTDEMRFLFVLVYGVEISCANTFGLRRGLEHSCTYCVGVPTVTLKVVTRLRHLKPHAEVFQG